MAFRFPLQTVLRLRRSLERQAEQFLFTIAAEIARLRTELDELDKTELQRRTSADEEFSATGAFGSSLQYIELCGQAAQQNRAALQTQIAEAENKRAQQLQIYLKARQSREILEGLRDRQQSAYNLDASRRAQQATDETFLLRSHFEKHEE
jgi:flagellar export protein FliJ